jgi:hypothetical protein
MQTVLIELKNSKAFKKLHDLEEKKIIRIVDEDPSQWSLPGKPISEEEFREWIKSTEGSPTMSLNEAKQLWKAKKKEFLSLIP